MDSLHPENGSHDLPRCSLRLDSIHVGTLYKSSRSLISNAFHSLSGMDVCLGWSILGSQRTDRVCVCMGSSGCVRNDGDGGIIRG